MTVRKTTIRVNLDALLDALSGLGGGLDVLHSLEWAGVREGQGDGPHSSGPGPKFPCCPVCNGLWPGQSSEARGHFIASAFGHRPGCRFLK